jgi:hypothetical protein
MSHQCSILYLHLYDSSKDSTNVSHAVWLPPSPPPPKSAVQDRFNLAVPIDLWNQNQTVPFDQLTLVFISLPNGNRSETLCQVHP